MGAIAAGLLAADLALKVAIALWLYRKLVV